MRIITKEYKVYKFEELTEEIKEKVIEKWYENEDYPCLTDTLEQDLENHFDEKGIFSDTTLNYSLSHCQGDGLNFSGDIDLKKFLDCIYSIKLPEWKKRGLCEYVYKVYSTGNDGRYCFANKNDIDFTYNYSDKKYKYLDKLFYKVYHEIQNYYMTICEGLKKAGYDEIKYRMNNAEFKDHCESNNYEFLENGEIFYGLNVTKKG